MRIRVVVLSAFASLLVHANLAHAQLVNYAFRGLNAGIAQTLSFSSGGFVESILHLNTTGVAPVGYSDPFAQYNSAMGCVPSPCCAAFVSNTDTFSGVHTPGSVLCLYGTGRADCRAITSRSTQRAL
jgi:hypothetical protein